MKSVKSPNGTSLLGQDSMPSGGLTLDDIVSSVAQQVRDIKSKRVIRLPKVMEKTGLCRSAVYAALRDGRFPSKIHLTQRSVGWLEAEIDQWIVDRMEARREN